MKHVRIAFGLMLLAGLLGSTAMAQVQRTFVSGLGSDGNPCSRTTPCRTFAQAISQTNAGGEVIVLDSAGYGPFTITQSVSITAPPGIYAGISVFSGTGIVVSTGGSGTVILRGLTLNSQGSTGDGISADVGNGTLHVENCIVNGFNGGGFGGDGLVFAPSGNGILEVKDSIFRGNTNGIDILGGTAAIEHVRLEVNGGEGLLVGGGGAATVRNSLASANGGTGFAAHSISSSQVVLAIENCSAVGNLVAVRGQSDSTGAARVSLHNSTASKNSSGFGAVSLASAPAELNIDNCVASDNPASAVFVLSMSTGVATARVSNSTVTGNGLGLFNQGSPAVILSRGNNTVEGNATNTFGTIGSYSAK